MIASRAREIIVLYLDVAVPTIFSPDTPYALCRRVSHETQTVWPALKFSVGGGTWETASRSCPRGRFLTSQVKRKAARNLPKFVVLWSALIAGNATDSAFAAPEENIVIATLLKGGWQIAHRTPQERSLYFRLGFIAFEERASPRLRSTPFELFLSDSF